MKLIVKTLTSSGEFNHTFRCDCCKETVNKVENKNTSVW